MLKGRQAQGGAFAQVPGKLIVMAACDEDDEGNLLSAFNPREFIDAARAKREAQIIAGNHAGVIAWQRSVDLQLGEFGPPEVLFQHGKIPDLE
jgi:hypothetical protein